MISALIFFIGIIIGWAACLYAPRRKVEVAKDDKYDKYKNKDGLYSRKAMKG